MIGFHWENKVFCIGRDTEKKAEKENPVVS